MLLRPAACGIEVFMLRRSARSTFGADAYVFPGGTLDEQDFDAVGCAVGADAPRIDALFRSRASDALPLDQPPLGEREKRALPITALRELFEESGVLFACTQRCDPITEWGAGDPDRARLRSGEIRFVQFLESRNWLADVRPLELFSHWITPKSEPRRYNVSFFVARVPSGQHPVADAAETHDGIWISPARALNEHAKGRFALMYPTRKHLERLGAFGDVDSVMEFARSKPILSVLISEENDFSLPAALEGVW